MVVRLQLLVRQFLVGARSWSRCICLLRNGRSWSGGRVGRHRPRPWPCEARIVLACAGPELPPIVAVARELRMTADTVRKWRRRFPTQRLDGLADEPRPGRPPTISVDQVEAPVPAVLQIMPGMPERRTHDSVRNGLTTLFAAFDVATVEVITALYRPHRAAEFKRFLIRIDKTVPAHLQIHLIVDNYGTHKTPGPRPPKKSSTPSPASADGSMAQNTIRPRVGRGE
ncbi:helix-turn-helix domain-containing protein [Streptomyces griseorubiginosus]|uniref:helix-turn-helix domain-containing protein n=1 Tax=Streptomyces griseorubiginosus TaxID=67304 RepID=UPI001AD7D2CB|nr:helix-turn-helix domain-containing protein [Streptomyces griseorubiginosus]MBO4257300.1 helix-turn-helix domain-containing protein [Streptomyces griseorubiginosus]